MSAAITDPAIAPPMPPLPSLQQLHFDWMVACYESGHAHGTGRRVPTQDEDTAAIVAVVRAEAQRRAEAREDTNA